MSSLTIDPRARPKAHDPMTEPFSAMPSIELNDKLLKEWRQEWRELCAKSAKQAEWLMANRPQAGWSDALDVWQRRALIAAGVNEQIIEIEDKINRLIEQTWSIVDGIEDPAEKDRVTQRIMLYAEAPF
jgi:hypothetical protein